MLGQLTSWFGSLFVAAFAALFDLLGDVLVYALDGVLSAVAALIGLIPVPDFASGGFAAVLGDLGGDIRYLIVMGGLIPALALYGAGFTFRLGRKLVTLFQW